MPYLKKTLFQKKFSRTLAYIITARSKHQGRPDEQETIIEHMQKSSS